MAFYMCSSGGDVETFLEGLKEKIDALGHNQILQAGTWNNAVYTKTVTLTTTAKDVSLFGANYQPIVTIIDRSKLDSSITLGARTRVNSLFKIDLPMNSGDRILVTDITTTGSSAGRNNNITLIVGNGTTNGGTYYVAMNVTSPS